MSGDTTKMLACEQNAPHQHSRNKRYVRGLNNPERSMYPIIRYLVSGYSNFSTGLGTNMIIRHLDPLGNYHCFRGLF